MDAPARYPPFPQQPPTRARCPKSLPRLATSTPLTTRNRGDVRAETPAIPTATVRDSDKYADGVLSNHVVDFSTFLSAESTVLRVAATGNHPSPATTVRAILTEIGDVRLVPSPRLLARRVILEEVLTERASQASASFPVSIWAVKDSIGNDERDIFCVYRTHKEVSVISPF